MSEINELKKLLADHESRISSLEKFTKTKLGRKKISTKRTSITDLFIELKEDGFFNKPQTRKNIVEKLEEMGHIYSSDSLNSPLSKALKARILGRKKVDGTGHYVKR